MKGLRRWNILMAIAFLASVVFCAYLGWHEQWAILAAVILITILSLIAFMGLWNGARKKRIEAEVDITRFLGRDAKDALNFGNIGLLTYDDEYNVTWTSEFFKERNIDIVNKRVTSWIREIRTLFEEEVDYVIGYNNSAAYEITRKEDSNVLFVRDVTEYERLRRHSRENSVVVGMMVLDNYMEYQAYENEEIMAAINVNLRSALINWAKERGMLIRRLRSDRFFLVLNTEIFDKARQEDFSILQTIKNHAKQMDISITLSMAFAYGTNNYAQLDAMVNQLIELAQSRGGDQVAFRHVDGTIQYVGGNSESSSQRSKVRVHTMAQSIQGAMLEAGNIFIAGHVDSDFDCMGSALGISSWVKSIGKTANIVLKDVPRDVQLQNAMDYYRKNLVNRHHFISPEQADAMIDPKSDLLIMVDHGVPAISSASAFISRCRKIIVIDHHRRGANFVPNPMLAYVESTSSSACELITEMLETIPNHVPIYEPEATIMYLGILVDTNRFKMHTDARTFGAASTLRVWGANAAFAEKALCVDYSEFSTKNRLIQEAIPYFGRFMVACIEDESVDKTMLAKIAQSLLTIQGCVASFVIARLNGSRQVTAVSARSDGTFNVQKIMEGLQGGGHFSAAAVEREDLTPEELKAVLLQKLKEETYENNLT